MLEPFVVSANRDQGVTTISVSGELDVATAPQLSGALQLVLGAESTAEQVVLDVSQLSFCGSVGLGVLVSADRLAVLNEINLAIVTGREGHVTTAMELTGLGDHLPVVATVDEIATVPGRSRLNAA